MYANYSNKIATDVSILPIKISACVNFLRTDLKINKNRKSSFFEWEIGLSKVRVKTFEANISLAKEMRRSSHKLFGGPLGRPSGSLRGRSSGGPLVSMPVRLSGTTLERPSGTPLV